MRRAATAKAPMGAQVSGAFRYPAPVGGMNNRDPAQNLPVTESPYMVNCYPTISGIKSRPNYTVWTTGMPAVARTLMTYTSNSGAGTVFAASGTAFYNITSSGAVGAAVVSGLSNSTWQYLNFTNSAGTQYLCAFNGVDSPRYWDGATWTAITGASTPSITGLTPTTVVGAFVHQRRLWFVQTNSLKAWYLPADSVGGAAQALDLGGIATRGGYIVAGSTWTIDGGDGVDDLWVVVTSNGQLIAYRGTDPTSASTWEIAGTWNISSPCGRLCLYKYRGDLLIITKIGILSARAIMSGLTDSSASVTDKISGTFRELALTESDRPQIVENDKLDLLVFNPGGFNGSNYYCYAMNRATGAWSGGWELGSTSMTVSGSSIYYSSQFSSGAEIRKMADSSAGTGTLTMQLLTCLNDLGKPIQIKNTKLGRVAGQIASGSLLGINLSIDTAVVTTPTQITLSDAITTYTNYYPIGGAGTNFSAFLYLTTTTDATIVGIDVIYEIGGLVGASSLT